MTIEPAVRDLWYPVVALAEMRPGSERDTILLGTAVHISRAVDGAVSVAASDQALPLRLTLGYAWTSLGVPDAEPFAIAEYDEPDRRNLNAATFGVRAAAPRIVENFLDMGHFSFVHTNFLGVEPFTEIPAYQVAVTPDRREILATDCRAYQPLASLMAEGGLDVAYTYRVPHPFCAVLYKSSPASPERRDVIGLFCQPVNEERSIVHAFLSMLDDVHSDGELKVWQQIIFGQDKPILENQTPVRMPLARGAELPVPADAASIAYRRWLAERGIAYGTVS